ncbi:MAG TPA: SUMF1/EgtB/PvdO family nonheme iron enzyme [Gemmataceae bacterium]|nr:SUMF1/EgtB/PvdO family nonheme iron enzyme [Gemmataceae bacterium]
MTTETNPSLRFPAQWEPEYVETRVLEITCDCFGYRPEEVSLESRLGEDIGGDSLDMMDFIYRLEWEFQITVSDQIAQEWFTRQPLSIRNIAAMVWHLQRTGRPDRGNWDPPQPVLTKAEAVPFTQLGGRLSRRDWHEGRLYEPLGRNREGHPQYRRRTDGMRCIAVPEGEVQLGSDEADALPDQQPSHRVTLQPFLLDAEPVSCTAFARFLNSVGRISSAVLGEWCLSERGDRRSSYFPLKKGWLGWKPLPETERQPIILVSWYGANAYSLWANRRDWRYYRSDGMIPDELRKTAVTAEPPPPEWLESFLPSEAQWEYAARGPEGRRYPWGEEEPVAERLRVARHVAGAAYTAETLPAAGVSERLGMSPFGLHHMAGNVWQWCRDWYRPDFYRRPEAVSPDAQNAEATGVRSERGGSWVGPAELARPTYRRGRPPQSFGRCLGFRCAGRMGNLS